MVSGSLTNVHGSCGGGGGVDGGGGGGGLGWSRPVLGFSLGQAEQ